MPSRSTNTPQYIKQQPRKRKILKIGFLLDDTLDKPDGVQQYIITLGNFYKKHGHEVHYLVAETTREDIENVHSLVKFVNVSFNHNNVRTPLPASKKAIKVLLSELELDVLHVQMPYSPLFAAKAIMSVPPETVVVGTFHTLPASTIHSFANHALALSLKRSLSRIDHCVAVSKPAADFAKKAYGLTCDIIPNAVEIEKFQRPPVKRSHKKRIVFLGRFVERKGARQLVLALRELVNHYNVNNLEVVMGGKGPDLENVKLLAERVGLRKIITFTGFVDEAKKPDLLASADIAVFPSLGGESFGIVLIEAMAAGSAIVMGGNNPGYASVLADMPELLFNPSDLEAFADKLRTMLLQKDPSRITLWQQEYVQQFDVSVVAKKLLRLYLD